MARQPNFFIIGAPKCGTTSLATWLAEHPRVFMSPIKEPFFYSTDIPYGSVRTKDVYERLFAEAGSSHIAVGEASTHYLYSKVAVREITKATPGARFIVMLRNPVEMAYALHEQNVRTFNDDVHDFSSAWQLTAERREGRFIPPGCKQPLLLDYPAWCSIGEQLERLLDQVPRKHVLILTLDDVRENPSREYRRVLTFLNLPDDGRDSFPVRNAAREWRHPMVGRAIRALAIGVGKAKHLAGVLPKRSFGFVDMLERLNAKERTRPALQASFRTELEAYFQNDVKRVEACLGRELPYWRPETRVVQ